MSYKAGEWRDWIFSFAIASVALSAAILLGSFLRHMQATDYFKQYEEALPWIRWNSSALIDFILAFFGKRYARAATAMIAFALCILAFASKRVLVKLI